MLLKNRIFESNVVTSNELVSILLALSIGAFLLIPFNYFLFDNVFKPIIYWLWFIIILSVCSINIFSIYIAINDQNRFLKCATRLSLYIRLVSFFVGASWGLLGALSYSATIFSENYHSATLLILIILLLVYFPILAQNIKSFYVFAIPLILPTAFILFFSGGTENKYTSLLIFVCLIMTLAFARWFKVRDSKNLYLQLELINQNKKVKEANESKSQFLASASHDLRQPLQALGFYITMLSDFLREPEKKALFDKTLRAYQALEHLLNQLLNISKLNANLVNVVKTDFSVEELFEKLRNDYQLRALDRGLSIEFTTKNYYTYSDIISVERIIRNLVENALRYTNDGNIKVSCELDSGTLVVRVRDTGIGISKEHIDKIFDEFYQVENPERDRNKGFGLGLYAVNKLAKLLDTKILVESEEGKGSTFSIALPAGEKPQVQIATQKGKSIGDAILEDKVVFLIDDDDVVLDSISRLFLSWKCLVLTANSYQNAMELLIKEEIIPEILVMDYRLPNRKNGVDLVQEICEYCKKSIPAIILTGDTGEESLTHINQSGLAFLHKPADPQKLKDRVKKLLDSRK